MPTLKVSRLLTAISSNCALSSIGENEPEISIVAVRLESCAVLALAALGAGEWKIG